MVLVIVGTGMHEVAVGVRTGVMVAVGSDGGGCDDKVD